MLSGIFAIVKAIAAGVALMSVANGIGSFINGGGIKGAIEGVTRNGTASAAGSAVGGTSGGAGGAAGM